MDRHQDRYEVNVDFVGGAFVSHSHGWVVTLNGDPCEYLACGSERAVFLHYPSRRVVKIATHTPSQCWDEFMAYHERLDDVGREVVPTIHAFGEVADENGWFVVMDYERLAPPYPPCSEPQKRWRTWVSQNLRTKYGMRDLHDNNLCWTDDGRIVLVDLGIGPVSCARPNSDVIRSVCSSLSPSTLRSLGLDGEFAPTVGV